ncbi:MAG TPA: hypothetical protein VK572_00465 [Burkholderiales bacterium]|nr:hypothetical protein [Burkholderiales bacterium]
MAPEARRLAILALNRIAIGLVGLGLPFFCTFVTQLFFLWRTYLGYEAVAVVAYGAVGILVARSAPSFWLRLIAIYLLLPVGMVMDIAIHLNLRDYVYQRNMLSFEILYFLLLVPLPLFLGGLVGRRFSRFRRVDPGANGAA